MSNTLQCLSRILTCVLLPPSVQYEGQCGKLSHKEIVEVANTVLRGSERAPKGFSEEEPEHSPQGFAADGALTLPSSTVWAPKALS